MLDDTQPSAEPREPRPYDLILLHPGRHGACPLTPLIIVDTVDGEPGSFEVHHLETHPDYWDWAATITADDIADVIQTVDGWKAATPPEH